MSRLCNHHRSMLLFCTLATCALGLFMLAGGCPTVNPGGDGTSTGQTDGTDDGSGGTGDGGSSTDGSDAGGTDGDADGGGSDTGGSGGIEDSGGSDGTDGSGGTDGSSSGDTTDAGTTITPTPAPSAVTLEKIAQTGDAVPDQAATVTFTDFGNPVIDSKGRIAFWARFSGTGAKGKGGLYVWDGALKRVVHDDSAVTGIVPGRQTADYFGAFGDTESMGRDLAWGTGDRLLFVSNVSGQTSSRGIYRWRATDSDIVRVADLEQTAAFYPDAAANAFSPDFILPGVNDSGIGVFGCDYLYITAASKFVRGVGVYTSNGTALTLLVDTNLSPKTSGNVPDQGTAAKFGAPEALTTAGATDLLFQAEYTGGSGSYGVYLRRGSSSYRVIDDRPSASWPGLAAGTQFYIGDNLPRLAIGPAGHIAVEGQLALGSAVRDAVIVWSFDTDRWYELTAEGAAATALLSGVNKDGRVLLLAGGTPHLVGPSYHVSLNTNMPSQLAGSTLTWKTTGGAINNQGRAVLPYTRNASPGLLFWTGEKLLLIADVGASVPAGATDILTIAEPERDRPARSGLLNDSDDVTFRAALGSSQAIYLARVR